jgi:hypothetical protein
MNKGCILARALGGQMQGDAGDAMTSSRLSDNADEAAPPAPEGLAGYDTVLNNAMSAYDALIKKVEIPDEDSISNILKSYLDGIQGLIGSIPDWQERLDRYVSARVKLDAEQKNLYRQISRAPTLSFEYVLNRPPVVNISSSSGSTSGLVAAPDLSTASLIFTASLFSCDYTLDARASFFNDARQDMSGNFRDFQLSGKLDIPVGQIPPFIVKGILTFSMLYEHLHQKPLGNNVTINDQTINQPGDIAIFQAKYTLPIGDSGVQIPIAFTMSNRTDLIKEKEIRGNIGFSFDLDKLFAKK